MSLTACLCHVDLDAIVHNFRRLGEPGRLMPVIKADAYGHGMLAVARVLDKAGARRFAVGCAGEGARLRREGYKQEIVPLMGCLNATDWELAREYRLTPLAGSFDDLDHAESAGAPQLAIKCDTGMARLGFGPEEASALLERLRSLKKTRPVMLLSHFACADMPDEDDFTKKQIEKFENFYKTLKPEFPHMARSLGNSAAALGAPGPGLNILRPGLALYGGNPFAGTSRESLGEGLKWAMSVSAPVIHIRELAPGQSVSYGRIFRAERPMRIAIVACGYANGAPRSLSGRLHVLVNGRRIPQIGRVCMNMLMLDISDAPDVEKGDSAWIMGGPARNGERPVDAQELAGALGGIPYEVMCAFGDMNSRVYN